MNSIDSLNTQYEKLIATIGKLQSYSNKVANEQVAQGISAEEKASRSVGHIKELMKEMPCGDYKLIGDSLSVGLSYLSCCDAIKNYKEALKVKSKTGIDSLKNEINSVEEKQSSFEQIKEDYYLKYGYRVESIDSLNRILGQCIDNAISIEEKKAEQLKTEAKEIVNREYSINLKMADPFQKSDILPETMIVARNPLQEVPQTILHDIGIKYSYQNHTIDLKNQGNVVVSSRFENMSDEGIDAFVIAYMLRFIETFPLGSVNIHIFDQNPNYLYKRLINIFQNESAGESVNKIVQLHTSLGDLSTFKEVICDDIFKKTNFDKPDLYAIYENDKSDPFNLIILRGGLVDSSGYASAENLETINSLTKPTDLGHRCGLRFLIIDNTSSFDSNLTVTNKHIIASIKGNCELNLYYSDGKFSSDNKETEVLCIQDNLEMFVQERSKAIIQAIEKREKSYVSLEDVSTSATDMNIGNIMNIPVGVSGGKTVELPFSCKDEGGTVAGQCIGYMAIGQSGSGKSSFFHSLVLNGCLKYTPEDLQFWLLDFKNGGASSKYSNSGVPHIKIIAENNKIDDALCLFQMVLEEMERRSNAFNENFTDNIVEYNIAAKEKGLEYFPRIIIAIDEVQEIFREDNASVIQKLISSISTRMRSAGMHFVMVAQNLSEGKSYMLKDAFLPSATGRVCFRVAQDIPRESGFDESFIERRKEISELKTGEAYVSYGKDTIKKVKMAYVSPQEMSEKIFSRICERYSSYSGRKPLVIGAKKRLTISDYQQGKDIRYAEILSGLKYNNGVYKAVVGEDVYRMSPLNIFFSPNENSSVLFLGSDKKIASSLCTSTAVSLITQGAKVHLFNGDRSKVQDGNNAISHPFMYLCQCASEAGGKAENHRLDQLSDVLRSLYTEYLKRQALVQKAETEDPSFDPIFLIINDLFGIESFIKNDMIESNTESTIKEETKGMGLNLVDLDFDYSFKGITGESERKESGQFRETIQTIMSNLIKNGYRYSIFMVLAIKGDPMTWRNAYIASEINNVILFNDTEYADQIENAYYLKEMLKNISSNGNEETMAVWSSKKTFSKVRPIIYDLSNSTEKDYTEKLIRGGLA